MKVLYIVPRLNNAGPINQLFYLVKEIRNREVEIMVLTIFNELEHDSRLDEFKALNVYIESLALERNCQIAFVSRRVNEIIRRYTPDIIHTETLPADLLMLFIKRKEVKWCSTMHSDFYVAYKTRFAKKRFSRIYAQICTRMHQRAIAKMDGIICCSYSISDTYRRQYPQKVTVVQNGIEFLDKAALSEVEKEAKKKCLGIRSDKKTVLIVGSIDERKNSEYIICELKDYLLELNAQLVFLGQGPKLEKCMMLSKGTDIAYKGQVDNVQDYLDCADLYLSASTSEGLPMSVIEAGMNGLPIVLSNIPEHMEIAMYEGEKDILFFEQGTSDILDVVRQGLKSNKFDSYTTAGYFERNFSAQVMANGYYDIYCGMVEE